MKSIATVATVRFSTYRKWRRCIVVFTIYRVFRYIEEDKYEHDNSTILSKHRDISDIPVYRPTLPVPASHCLHPSQRYQLLMEEALFEHTVNP